MATIKFESMIGLVMDSVVSFDDEMHFKSTNGKTFKFYHNQSCCEDVHIDDICGDLLDLMDSPILIAEEVDTDIEGLITPCDGIVEWTFYKYGTIKGSVTVRWYGSSNGYYSTSVDFSEE